MRPKILRYPAILPVFALLFVSGCEIVNGPDFSNVPDISFNSFEKAIVEDALGNAQERLTVIVDFQDGDGDLGLTPEQRQNDPKFQEQDANGQPNKYYYNYFVRVFRKQNGVFTEFFPTPSYSGAFPVLKPDGKAGPIEGDIQYDILFPTLSSPPNDTLKFEIFIADRALQDSNTIETEEVVINQQ